MAALMRAPDWPERFAAFIEARRHMPFAWGSNDCALFAADCVAAMTGVDLAEPWRGYDSEAGAAAHISAVGGMQGFARELVRKATGLAQRGDIVLAVIDDRPTFGICVGESRYAAPGGEGLVFRPMSDAVAVFEV